MRKIIFSDAIDIPPSCLLKFSQSSNYRTIRGGMHALAAITEDGQVSSWSLESELALRDRYWVNMRDMSCGSWFQGMAIGLQNDGRCMIGKRGLRKAAKSAQAYIDLVVNNFSPISKDTYEPYHKVYVDFDAVNNEIRSLENVVQVAASDNYFVVLQDGTVKCVRVYDQQRKGYTKYYNWKNIKYIDAQQDFIMGVTYDGKIVTDGLNECSRLPDDISVDLACAYGTDWKGFYWYSQKDGFFQDERKIDFPTNEVILKLESFCDKLIALTADGNLYVYQGSTLVECRKGEHIIDAALFEPDKPYPATWAAISD